jgi:hypothetical protein
VACDDDRRAALAARIAARVGIERAWCGRADGCAASLAAAVCAALGAQEAAPDDAESPLPGLPAGVSGVAYAAEKIAAHGVPGRRASFTRRALTEEPA